MSGLAAISSPAPAPRAEGGLSLAVQSLRIERMPGVGAGAAFEIDAFARGVTIVHGPNGAGKTTTARAIERLLWPAANRPEDAVERSREGGRREVAAEGRAVRVSATWLVDGATASVELEGRQATWRRGGVAEPAPDAGPAELRHRYRLALADLLAATDEDDLFAAAVQRALAGGFDLASIRTELGAGERPSGRRAEAAALRAALGALREAQQRAEALERDRTHTLPGLERQLAEAREEAADADAVSEALRRLAAEEAKAAAEASLTALPVDRLRRCGPADEDTLSALSARVDRAEQDLGEARRVLAESAARLGGRAIGPAHVAEADALDELAAELDRLASAAIDVERNLANERERRDQALRPLTARGQQAPAPEAVAAALAGLRDDAEATRAAREGHQLRARREVVEAQRRLLAPRAAAERDAASAERVRQTRHDLSDWLATGPPTSVARPPWTTLVAVALAALLVFCLAVFHDVRWLFVLLLPAGIAFAATRSPSDARREERRTMQDRVERSGVRPPQAWTIDGVTARLRELEAEAAEATLAERAMTAHVELDAATRALSEAEARHRQTMKAIEERFGAMMPADEAWLPVLAAALADWQRAQRAVSARGAELAALERRAEEVCRAATARVAPLALGELPRLAGGLSGGLAGGPAGGQSGGLSGGPSGGLSGPEARIAASAIRRIARTLRELIETAKVGEQARREIHDRLEPAAQQARGERDRFFVERGLAPGDVAGLRALAAQRPAFMAAESALVKAQGALELIAVSTTLPTSRAELEAIKRRCDESAQRIETLSLEVGAIRGALDRAATGADVANATAAVDEARARLARLREDERRAAATDTLLRFLDGRARERSMPEVFARAEHLLARFTHGRFELRLDDSVPGPTFRVHDKVAGLEKPLAALSSGERVQLLCAVRLAFIEHEERRPAPLLVDEALGTSDDRRATALMDALIDAARRGRQVICFTAQLDEVARWRARLAEAPDVPHAFVDLGAIRSRDAARAAPLPDVQPAPRPPAPEGVDHAGYGILLQVPALSPFEQGPEQVHLWHAISDVRRLHALISAGFTTIGQVLHYRAATGDCPPGADEGTFAAVAAAARGLHRLFECWRRGRCRPIGFEELDETNVVSAAFAERMRELLHEVDGDPARLLGALEAGRLPRWRTNATEELREALTARGLLPVGERLSPQALELEVRTQLHEALRCGTLDLDWPRLAVARVGTGENVT